MRDNLAERLVSAPGSSLPEVARTLADRRVFSHRRAFVATGPAQAALLMRDATVRSTGGPSTGGLPAGGSLDRAAFLFPGQGTLRHAAGAAPYRLLAGFRAYFDEVRDAVRRTHGLNLSPVVIGSGDPDWFADTVHQQLGLFALGYALGRQLGDWGVRPKAMLGNSIGEYAAATLAGVWTASDAASLVYQRARAMWATEPGRMAAVSASRDEVTRRIGSDGETTVAVVGPGEVVVSGPQAAMEELLAGGALRGLDVRPLNSQRAFHSAAMDPAVEVLRAAVASTRSQRPRVRLIGNESGDWADPDAVTGPGYWVGQLRQPVLLDGGVATLLSAGCDTFIELGPGTSMIGTLRRHRSWDTGHATIAMLGRHADDGEPGLLRAVGALWERGADQALADVFADERSVRCSLPAHPFTAADPQTADPRPADPQTADPQTADPQTADPQTADPQTADPQTGRAPHPARQSGREPRWESPPQVQPAPRAGQSLRPALEGAWRAALGVPAAADTDDFFALGGESLMAVNLMNKVRQITGRTIPVTEFSADATFGRLVRLVEADLPAGGRTVETESAETHRPGLRSPGIVTLRHGGAFRPLFLAADALGTTAGYRVLAGLLDGRRPVYGLEPAGDVVAGKGAAVKSIEGIAADHVAAMLRAQRSGPYTIGGWSFGAVVAHEMAHQLTRRGEQVDLLVCLDGIVPSGRLPARFDPGLLVGGLRLQASAALGIGPVGRRVRRTPELRRLFIANLGALPRYRPRPVPCPAVVFTAGGDRRTAARLHRRLSPLYGGGVQVHHAGGDHWSMLALPHARDLAARLHEALADGALPDGATAVAGKDGADDGR
jgi:phthiocerol/phenolphthiocerol synthesis type-I polyketide synthase E